MKMRRLLTAFLVAMIALPVSLGFAAKKNAPLKVGDKGWKVKTVQTKLNTLGLKTPLTGKYSRDLEKQVRIFQKTHKLPVTGKVDDKTYFRINEAAFEKEGIHGVKGKDVVRTASKYKGVPYSFGGTTPRAFDCSGFVQYVFKKHKADLPRTADLQYEKGLFVTMNLCGQWAFLECDFVERGPSVQPFRAVLAVPLLRCQTGPCFWGSVLSLTS